MNRLRIAANSFYREREKGLGYATDWFVRRFYYRYVHGRLGRNGGVISSHPISIIVPAVEKDAEPLRQCLAAANDMIRHPLDAKWVVGPESVKLRSIAREAGWDFVLEDVVLPKPAGELRCRGWVLQQFIKFNAAWHVPTEDYLVLDADTVFLRPQTFFRNGKTVLRYSDQYELLYSHSLEVIFGHNHRFPVSFVAHHTMFNRDIVKELLSLIERRFGREWWEAILQEVDTDQPISFSEYELYGNYVVSLPSWKKRFLLEYWAGLERFSEHFRCLSEICASSAGRLNSVSFHWHTQ